VERRWVHLHNVDIKRLRQVHLLIDELRNRLRELHMGKIRQNGTNLVFFEIQSRIARVQYSNSL
jgi:hypothetical protein